MAFRIPPPWDPGYALPSYVTAEGLRSRAFITKWMPRGTYDDPDVCNPSWDHEYAVPQYVKDEGYGQGVYVTEWAPRGFYVGQVKRQSRRIRRAQEQVGENIMPGPFAEYGRQTAAVLIGSARRLPVAMRKDGLRKMMVAINPALYEKTLVYAREHASRGLQSDVALELGLSKAMSQGIAKEIVQVGKAGKRPSPKGQLGLGCYGCGVVMGLGAVAVPKGITVGTGSGAASGTSIVAPPSVGQCTADGVYIYKMGADGQLFWARRSVSDNCTGTYLGTGPATGSGAGGITGGGKAGGEAPTVDVKMITVGPFTFPVNTGHIVWGGQLPAEWQAAIVAELQHETATIGSDMVDASPGKIYNRLRDFIPSLPTRINQTFVGIQGAQTPRRPIVTVKRPDNGEDWGLYMTIMTRDPSKAFDSTTNPYVLELLWRKVDTTIFDWMLRVVGKIIDVAKDALDAVGGLACTLLSSQGAGIAAGAAATAEGQPPATGAQGVAIAQAACGQPPPAPGAGAAADDWIMPVAIAGGIALAALYLWPKKKKASTP